MTETNETNNPTEKFLKWLPAMQWIATILIGVCVFFQSFQSSQSSQAAQIQEIKTIQAQDKARLAELKTARDKQLDEYRGEMATKADLQNKFETMLKLQELMREDIKHLRESYQREQMQR